MRILHTSDWHLGRTLGIQDLSADLERQLRRLAAYLEEYRVDVMLVAGDIFDDPCYRRNDRMHAAITAIADVFSPFLARGGTILAISGNHDVQPRLDTFREMLRLALLGQPQLNGDYIGRRGTFHLFTGPHNIDLIDGQGQVVQFQAMPYPTFSQYLKDEATQVTSPESRNERLQKQFLKLLHERQQKYRKVEYPSVLLSHIPVRGLAMQNGHMLTDADAVLIGQDAIDKGWIYAAFGDIHKPQTIDGEDKRKNARYAGSLMRLDLGEAADDKSCVIFEIGQGHQLCELEVLPLPCPPIASIIINAPEEVTMLRVRYPLASETLANITLNWQSGWEVDRDALLREVCTIFPRWYARSTPSVTHNHTIPGLTEEFQIANVPTTVRDFARVHFAQSTERTALLELLETLLAEEV